MEVGLQDKLAANVDHMEGDVQGKRLERNDGLCCGQDRRIGGKHTSPSVGWPRWRRGRDARKRLERNDGLCCGQDRRIGGKHQP